MLFRCDIAEVRNLTDRPEATQIRLLVDGPGNDRILAHDLQRRQVARWAGAGQPFDRRRGLQTFNQSTDGGEIQIAAAPLGHPHRIEPVGFNLLHNIGIDVRGVARGPERPIIHIAPGAPGNLADLVGPQRTHAHAVELSQRGKRHMVHIHVQAHPDGVRRHQEIHFA